MTKIGVLLINLGTPDHATPRSIRAFLKQFLQDPRVIDLPTWLRHILVNFLIVPFRYKNSTHAYQQIWTMQGSPLLIHSRELVAALQKELGTNMLVELGMRYGQPSIQTALAKLKHCQEIIVIPLFPQYSSAASGSAIEEVMRVIKTEINIPSLYIKSEFYADAGFIRAYAALIKENLNGKSVDAILFSYHGLPERHIQNSGCEAVCSMREPCPAIHAKNASCYRAQCYATSRLLAQELQLHESQYYVSFQSRLGRLPWIQPYTDVLLSDLIKNNVKNLAVVCPSFVADCLETLEEINLRAREQWRKEGGAEFIFIPCLNKTATWVQGLANMIRQVPVNKDEKLP